jgi:glycine betaine/proline transport system permease protein
MTHSTKEKQAQSRGKFLSPRIVVDALHSSPKTVGSIFLLIISTIVLILVWGSGMAFPFDAGRMIGKRVDSAVEWMTINGAPLFDLIRDVVLFLLLRIEAVFIWIPWPVFILAISLMAWKMVGFRVALFSLVSLLAVGLVGLWESAMETMALVVVVVILAIGIGVPSGIMAARNNTVDAILRPILDGMQTMPSFVYLVPAIMFFSLGNVPAVMASVIYSIPPAIRLTNLGIRQVSPQTVEAARSFGTTPHQLLFKVQLPMAVPTIMAGINQTIMMALAMVVIASLVGAGGLGEDVNRALGRFEPGNALLGGTAIVIFAVIVDRITQAWAKSRKEALQTSDD